MQGTSKEVRGKQLLLLCWQVQPQLLLLLLLPGPVTDPKLYTSAFNSCAVSAANFSVCTCSNKHSSNCMHTHSQCLQAAVAWLWRFLLHSNSRSLKP